MNGIFKFVRGRRGARPSKLHVPVVNAPIVDEPMIAVEHRDLGRGVDVCQLDEDMIGIAQGWQPLDVVVKMLANLLRGIGFVREYKTEVELEFVARADMLNDDIVADQARTVST